MALMVVILLLFHRSLSFCWCLNSEGWALLRFRQRVVRDPFDALSGWNAEDGDIDPCSWFGIECSDGKVVILDLKNLCLEGALAPELGKLTHIKSIILRNNSFFGSIPKEMAELKELEVLDLGYNNFTGPFPSDFVNNLSLAILLLDNNKFLSSLSPELYQLEMLSEFQVDQNQLTNVAPESTCNHISISRDSAQPGDITYHRKMQMMDGPNLSKVKRGSKSSASLLSPSLFVFSPLTSPPSPPASSISSPETSIFGFFLIPTSSPSPSPSPLPPPILPPSPASIAPAIPPATVPIASPFPSVSAPSPVSIPTQINNQSLKSNHHTVFIWVGLAAGLLVFLSAVGIFFCWSNEVVMVKPWATGLSGQLTQAFVTGVPKLNRSELETACEDFSNIIDTLSDGTVYKGTLSSGVEIAVICSAVTSENWSIDLEAQFIKNIETLSKVNHKNFVNLIGYCEEENPFTRMMVFEYAPNGTLFEHLHIKEAEHLDWKVRLRIAMGIAYCLEYMHQLNPPIVHGNIISSSIHLTEDYAAKISDFQFWNEETSSKMKHMETLEPERDVYSFGVILFEMINGRVPNEGEWALDYLEKEKMLDPSLKSFTEEEVEKLIGVVKYCVSPDPKQKPTMREVAARLKEITGLGPDGATPKLTPLWWAELEIMSTDAN